MAAAAVGRQSQAAAVSGGVPLLCLLGSVLCGVSSIAIMVMCWFFDLTVESHKNTFDKGRTIGWGKP